MPVLLDETGRWQKRLAVGLDQRTDEGAEAPAESMPEPLTGILVLLGQSGEALLDVALDAPPAELEIGKLLLQPLLEAGGAIRTTPVKDFKRLSLGVDRELDALPNLGSPKD